MATKSPSAPATMTVDQLRDVFACRVTNWAQLPGGREGAIRRVMPPSWSGTAIAFIRLLGGSSPSTMSRPADPNAYGPLDRGCPAVRTMQENAATDRVLGSATIAAQAILPYSAGTWAWQASHTTRRSHNGRGGIRLGAVSTGGVALHPLRQDGAGIGLDPTVVREPGTAPAGATVFPGAYSLYTGVSVRSPGYGAIGSGGRCQGEHHDDILGGGFLPLEPASGSSSTCRLEVPVRPGLADTPPPTVTTPTTTTITPAGTPPPTTIAAPTTTRPVVTTTVPTPTAPPPPAVAPVTPPGPLVAPRLFADSSLWNTPKAPTAFAPAADATLQRLRYGLNNSAFSHPFYRAKSTDPMTTFRLGAGWGRPTTTMVTPAPAGMRPASGSDGVMAALLTDGTLLDMYGVSGGGTDWTATYYGTSDGVHGPGFGQQGTGAAIGTTAIGSPQAAGTILASDVVAGVIPHTLFIAYDYADEGGVGTSGTPSVAPTVAHDDGGGPGPLPQGGLLVATGDMPSGLNVMERALWTAAPRTACTSATGSAAARCSPATARRRSTRPSPTAVSPRSDVRSDWSRPGGSGGRARRRHSDRNTTAGRVRAASAAGAAASRLAITSATTAMSTTPTVGTTGTLTIPRSSANRLHNHRPTAMPSGMPTSSETATTVVA